MNPDDDMMIYMGVRYDNDDGLYKAMEKARPIVRAQIISYIQEILWIWNDKQITELMHHVNMIGHTEKTQELFDLIDPELWEG